MVVIACGIERPSEVAFKGRRELTRKGVRAGSIAIALMLFGTGGALAQNCNVPDPQGITGVARIAGVSAGTASAVAGSLGNVGTAFFTQQTSAFVAGATSTAPDQASGGVWARVVGGTVETESDTKVSAVVAPTPITPLQTTSGTCASSVSQDFFGLQVGADVARLNVNGWNVHWGATAGYLEANGKDITPGSIKSEFQVPFVGSYLVVTHGSFFADVMLRREFYNVTLNSPGLALFNQPFGARGWSFSAGAGYNFALQNGFFVEPSAGVLWSRTEVDRVTLGGLPVGLPPIGTLQIDDIESLIGRATVRVGTNFTSNGLAVQPFASASVFHEFADDITSNFVSCANCLAINGFPTTITIANETSRVGTYGQLSLGVAAQVIDTGWVGFVRGDYRKGENLEGWTANAGLRYNFVPERPLPVGKMVTKGPRPVVAAPYNWSGFYFGAHLGVTQGRGHVEFVGTGVEVDPYISGYLAGGQAGYNFQFGPFVIGAEVDVSATNTNGARTCGNATVAGEFSSLAFTCESKLDDWIATAAVRLGTTWWSDRALFFVKAGGAVAEQTVTVRCIFQVPDPGLSPCISPAGAFTSGFSVSETNFGGMVGFGTEFGLTRNWSAKSEFNFIFFPDQDLTAFDGSRLNIGTRVTQAKIGVNYRFGP